MARTNMKLLMVGNRLGKKFAEGFNFINEI